MSNSIEHSNWAQTDGIYAEMNTNKGKIVCRLEFEKTPMTVGNFVALAEGKHPLAKVNQGRPFYDGITFHRVIADFMVQSGDPKGTGAGDPGYRFVDEFDPSLRHTAPGVLSMANAGPGTNGSQFFITHVPTSWLDGKHSVFGQVVEGMNVVNAIEQGDKIETLRIVRVGAAAEAFDAVDAFTNGEANMRTRAEAQRKAKLEAWHGNVKEKYPTAQMTDSGLYYVVDVEGKGPKATKGQTVVAHYTGTLFDNGQKFDSSKDRGKEFEFPVGMGRVIKGWDEGFMLFNIGSKGKLIIPSSLGYGARGAGGVIPPHADLVFEVEMIGVK